MKVICLGKSRKRPKISHSSIECYFDTSIVFLFIINCNNNIKIQEYRTILYYRNEEKREKNESFFRSQKSVKILEEITLNSGI